MRVAINLEQLLSPSPGGVGRYAAKLAVHLQDLGVDVLPVVARHTGEQVSLAWEAAGAQALPAPRRLPLPRPALYDAWHLLSWPPIVGKGENVNVVHAPSLAVPPRRGVPLVVSIHDAAPWRHPEAFSARGRWFHNAGLRAALRRADCVLTGTQAAADELAELARVPAGRTRVVPYGVDQPVMPGAGQVGQTLGGLGLDGAPYVLWVGSLEPRKGVGTLVSAMARLAGSAAEPGCALVLAGYPGWQNDGLVDGDDVARLGPALHRLGRVSESTLQALYAGAAVFAFPSNHEGFGLPVLEAMAAGAPVVASDIPALREVTGGAAELVAPGDVGAWAGVLEEVIASPARRSQLSAAGRERAAHFSWGSTAAGTLEVYRQLVG